MKIQNEFHGPQKKRHCTDIFFLLLLLLCTAMMILIGLGATGVVDLGRIEKGDPARLLNGVDYKGNTCGSSGALLNLRERWFPNHSGNNVDTLGNKVSSGFSICVSSCPKSGEKRSDPYHSYGDWTANIDTVNILNYCAEEDSNNFVGDVSSSYLSDFLRAISVISVISFGLSVVLSLLFLSVIRLTLVLRSLVWIFVVLVFLLFGLGAFVTLGRANYSGGILSEKASFLTGITASENNDEIKLLTFVGVVLALMALLWMCLICFMRDRIALAIDLLKETLTALSSMPLLIYFPIIQVILYVGFTAGWAICFFYLASSGVIQSSTDAVGGNYKVIKYSDEAKYTLIFMIFGWFWNFAFLEAYGQLISAHSVLMWYFSDARTKIGSGQVLRSAAIITRYHLGTAAFGSLLIATVRSLRMILEYIKYRVKPQSSCLVKYTMCCFTYCLLCFDHFLKYINKHAYVQCALMGTGFFPSAKNAYNMIVRNLGRLSAITMVGDFVILICKFFISLTCAAVAYAYMTAYMSSKLRGIVLPTVLVLFLSFFTCTIFFGVISSTADSVLQAYVTDEEHSMGLVNMSHENSQDLKVVIEEQREAKEANSDDDLSDGCFPNNSDESKEDPSEVAEIDNAENEIALRPPTPPTVVLELSQREKAEQHLQDIRKDGSDVKISLGLDLSRIIKRQQRRSSPGVYK